MPDPKPLPRNSRELAFRALFAVNEQGAYPAQAMERLLRASTDPRTRELRQARAMLYTTLRNQAKIDSVAMRYSRKPLGKLDPQLRNLYRLSLAQLLFMDGAAPYAVCHSMVALTRKLLHNGAASYLNACLRAFLRDVLEDNETNDKQDQAAQATHEQITARAALPDLQTALKMAVPTSYHEIRALFRAAGKEDALWKALEGERALYLRLTHEPGQSERDKLFAELAKEGVEVSACAFPGNAIRLVLNGQSLTNLDAWKDGRLIVQGRAAQCAVQACEFRGDERCVDLCAAPGGKTLQIAEKLEAALRSGGNPASQARASINIQAWDIYPERLELLRENFLRLELGIPLIYARDASRPLDDELNCAFDFVLADVPCSSSGLLVHEIEMLNRFKRADRNLLGTQQAILSNAAKLTAPGGMLLYSTCSIDPRENRQQIETFLKSSAGSDFFCEYPSVWRNACREGLFPGEAMQSSADGRVIDIQFDMSMPGWEGFYICYLRRRNHVAADAEKI